MQQGYNKYALIALAICLAQGAITLLVHVLGIYFFGSLLYLLPFPVPQLLVDSGTGVGPILPFVAMVFSVIALIRIRKTGEKGRAMSWVILLACLVPIALFSLYFAVAVMMSSGPGGT
jgi:hypothetical protein